MSKPNVNDFTGAVNVNANITPITRQKIEAVTPEKWAKMSISLLLDQRLFLVERSVKASQAGHSEMAQQIQLGINSLDALLQYKAELEEENPNANSGFIR